MIVSLYKPLGVSTHSFVKAYGEKIDEKVTHTGSLDPMAEGVVVVLTGQDRFKKEEMSDTDKEYEFGVLVGFQTDSWDVLGLVDQVGKLHTSYAESYQVEEKIAQILPEFVGEYDQVIPRFSAKRINGESYFDKAKRGEEWEPATQSVAVYSLNSLDSYSVGEDTLKQEIENKISKVRGDFRQEEILKCWESVTANRVHVPSKQSINRDCHATSLKSARNEESHFLIFKFSITCSRRFYIRGLVRDISTKLNIPMTTWSIVRTRNGEYSIADCKIADSKSLIQ